MALDGNALGSAIIDALDAYIAAHLAPGGQSLSSPLDREEMEQEKASALVDYLEDHAEDLAALVDPFIDGGGGALDPTLDALADLDSAAGLLEQTGADAFTKRAIGVGASTSIPTRGDADTRYAAAAHSHADPWTYIKLASDHANSTTTPTLSDLKFTPATGKQYEVWGILLLRSAASTTGVRAGLQFPAPGASPPASNGGGGLIEGPGSTTTSQNLQRVRPDGTNLALTSVAHPGGTDYYIATVWATVITGATSSGDFGVTLESEIAASEVRIGAGSFIRYREI